MRIRAFFVLAFFLFTINVFAQSGTSVTPSLGDLPKIIPPTPEVSALLKADFLNVTPNLGSANFSIPLYTLTIGGFGLPISLNYNSTGVKVDDVASMVGLGWTLNYGGVVSRTIMDIPDEVRDPISNNLTSHNFTTPDYALLDYFDKEDADKQSDIFSFSFGNYSGKFIMDQNLNPKPLSTYNLKIYTINGAFMEGFKIITDDGSEYFFQSEETSLSRNLTGTNCKSSAGEYMDEVNTSWYLTKIVLPSRQKEMNFTYITSSTTFSSGINQSITANISAENYQCSPFTGPSGPACGGEIRFSSCSRIQVVQSKFISKIQTTDGDKIEFFYDSQMRQDLNGGLRLASFKVTSFLGSSIKHVHFNGSYQLAVGSTGDSESRRLFLESVFIRDGLNTSQNQSVYSFSYLNYTGLPKRNSLAQDIYGFYNGKNSNSSLIPKLEPGDVNYTLFNNGTGYGNVTFGDRRVDTVFSMYGMLKRIVYPTGGYDTIIYTPNYIGVVTNGTETARPCGGISVKKISSYTGVSQLATEKEYVYRSYSDYKLSTFLLTANPKFSEVRSPRSDGYVCTPAGSMEVRYCFGPSCTKATTTSTSYYPVTTFGSQHVYHRVVMEFNKSKAGDNGLIEHKYLFYMDGGLVPGVKMGTEILGTSYNIVPDILVGENETYIYKKENGVIKLVKSTVNKFDYLSQSFGFNHFVRKNYNAGCSNRPGTVHSSELEAYDVMEGRIYFNTPVLRTVTEKTYDDNNAVLETITNMEYNVPLYSYPKVIKVNDSKGAEIRTEKKYPLDYPTLGFMAARNIVNPVIEEKVFRNNTLQTTKTQTYVDWFANTNLIVPQSIELKIGTSVKGQKIVFRGYNANGTLTEFAKENNFNQTYIWDYNSAYPIAEVQGASTSSTAYTSFEADGTGNWSGIVSSSIQGTGGITGKKYYSRTGFSLSKSGLSASSAYSVTYWSKNGAYSVNGATGVAGRTSNGWTLYEHQFTNPASGTIVVSGSGAIDELRLYPNNAMMNTYTYDPLVGMTSQTDITNRITYYEYDNFGRLLLVRDQDRNILKKYCYNYQGQVEDCTVSTSALWQNTATTVRCKQNSSNQNTGEQEQEQVDNNPYSVTYGQTRWIVIGTNSTACPLPVACTTSICSGLDKKCINNVCRIGNKVYTSSEYDSVLRKYVCIYHYEWSDGSWSQNYTEISSSSCGIAVE